MGESHSADDKKGWGKSVLGWFLVDENPKSHAGTTDADALIAKYAGAGDAPPAAELAGPLPAMVAGKVDFDAVFEAAGIGAEERGRVDKARDLLRSLPVDTPQPTKKQIVEASLRAFGIATEKIIQAGVAEIGALEAFIQKGRAEAQSVLSDGNQRIAELEKQIAEVRAVMQQATTDQETRVQAANAGKLGVQQVLEFFGQEAVAKAVQDAPKLQPTKS